jgi:hypothetical protein
MRIGDRAYQWQRLYGRLSPGEALTNAESYAMLARELATGPIGGTAPPDTFEDCPTDWRRELSESIARAQRWNDDAENVTTDNRTDMLAAWASLAQTYLGGQQPAIVAAAMNVFKAAATQLAAKVDFECEPGATGGRCATYQTYWWALGDFHICPSWRNLPAQDDRTESLLGGLYGYFRLVDDGRRGANLAALARALYFLINTPPTAADVNTALTAAAAAPQPAPARPPGPQP